MSTAATATAASPKGMRRVVAASFIGTTIEWYDFFIYGTMAALVFSKLFFPELNSAAATIAAFATFGAGFLARPLGGIVFGHFGDRAGRKAALVVSLSLMGATTFLIGVLPTYASIGLAAPLLLTALRFLQGLALGGEWSGAAALTVEHAPEHRRGFYGSFVQLGSPAGALLSAVTAFGLSQSLSPAAFLAWGWRVPFLLSAVLLVVGLFIRLSIEETPVFRELQSGHQKSRLPIVAVLRRQWRTVCLVGGMHLANTTVAYILTVFLLSYGVSDAGFSQNAMLGISIAATIILLPLIPVIGSVSDRIGRRPVYLAGTLLTMGAAFPLFWLLDTGQFVPALLGTLGLLTANYLMYTTQGAFFTELFDADVRVSGAALGVQVATVLAGGTAPLIAQSLLSASDGQSWSVALYIVAVGAVSTIAALFTRETNKKSSAVSLTVKARPALAE